jgi:DNA end-binding protein Ku
LKDKERVGRIVMANREHVIALEPLGKGILGTTLRYDYEVRDEKEYFAEVPNPRVPKESLMRVIEAEKAEFEAAQRAIGGHVP